MLENKDICYVVCDSSQYNCCGDDFYISDYICWSATPFSKSGYKNFKIDTLDNIDYSYEECAGGLGDLIGKVKKITLLSKKESGIYEKIQDYSSGKELSNESRFDYMLIMLEDSSFKEYEEETSRNKNEECVITGNLDYVGVSLSKELKKMNFEIKLIGNDEKAFANVDRDVRKIKSFSRIESYFVNLENKKDFEIFTENREYKRWIIVSNDKIYKNVINRYKDGYKDCDIYHINYEKGIIENHKIISKWKYYTFDEIINMSEEEKDKLYEVEKKDFNIKNSSFDEIVNFVIFRIFSNNLFKRKESL